MAKWKELPPPRPKPSCGRRWRGRRQKPHHILTTTRLIGQSLLGNVTAKRNAFAALQTTTQRWRRSSRRQDQAAAQSG
jgi:hypothetical protein